MLAQLENENHQHQRQHQHQQVMMKGKRTKRSRTPLTLSTSGEESCLVATSSSTTTTLNVVESGAHICNSSPTPTPPPTTTPSVTEEEEDMANCLIMLAQGAGKAQKLTHTPAAAITTARSPPSAGVYIYECKTCNRCFSSFQALGGHRASHRKPKSPTTEAPAPATPPAPARSLSDDHQDYFPSSAETSKIINKGEDLGLSLQMACNSSNTLSASPSNTKLNKVHACAICGSEFSSGQALGGHMRRHRPIATSGGGGSQSAKSAPARNLLCLDLNLPAADEQDDQQQQQQKAAESAKFIFGSGEKTLVFANSLVDCRY